MDIIKKAEEFAKKEYEKNDSKHQWSHVKAVLKRALEIAEHFKNADFEALKLAIIFHDIDYSVPKLHTENSIKIAEKFLRENNYPEDRIKKVKEIMFSHTTHLRKEFGDAKLLEGKIIYDADKSIFITNPETYEKYFSKLYLKESKKFVKKPEN